MQKKPQQKKLVETTGELELAELFASSTTLGMVVEEGFAAKPKHFSFFGKKKEKHMEEKKQPHKLTEGETLAIKKHAEEEKKIKQKQDLEYLSTLLSKTENSETILAYPELGKTFETLCASGPALKSAAAVLVLNQIDQRAAYFFDSKEHAEANYTKYHTEAEQSCSQLAMVEETVKQLREQLNKAEEQLTAAKEEEQRATHLDKKWKRKLHKTTSICHSLATERNSVAGLLAEARSLMEQIFGKASSKSLSDFSCEDIGLLLEYLGLSCHAEKFANERVDGAALEAMKDKHLIEIGIKDLVERKTIIHCRELVHFLGVVRVPSPQGPLSWKTDDVVQWINSQSDTEEAVAEHIKENQIPGWVLLHLNEPDLRSLGLNLGQALKLGKRIEQLRSEVFSQLKPKSAPKPLSEDPNSTPPAEYLCPITCSLMKDPVLAVDGYFFPQYYISNIVVSFMNEKQLLHGSSHTTRLR